MITKKECFEAMKMATLLDDVFMTRVFDNDNELTEFVLKIILNRNFKVKSVKTQYGIKNLTGHDVRLDVYAESEDGKAVNIEIQRQDKGAAVKRARYNSSMLDTNSLPTGENFDALPETYVIFITERDVLKLNEPIYFIERMIVGKNEFFNDAAHIVYVNNSIQDDTPLGKLMHDFSCADPAKMFYKEIIDKVRLFKVDEEEDFEMPGFMDKIIEKVRRETEEKVRRETAEEVRRETEEKVRRETAEKVRRETEIKNALKIIENGKLTLEEIAKCFSLPIEEVRALAAKNSV